MRISTTFFMQQGVDAITNQQQKISKLQLQLASGTRVLTPSDDPAASTRALSLDQVFSQQEQYIKNAVFAESKLSLEEDAIDTTENSLQRIKELAIAAASQLNGENDRLTMATEVRQLFNQIVSTANYRDPTGEYLFAGFQSKTKPFNLDNSGNVVYAGDQGQRIVNIGNQVQVAVNDPGDEVFNAIRNGNGIFAVAAGNTNTGTGLIGEGSTNGTFISDTYMLQFTQVLATDDITYTITGASSGVVGSGTYATAAQISANDELSGSFSFNGAQIDISGRPANSDTFSVSPSSNQDLFTTINNFISALEMESDDATERAAVQNGINRSITDLNQSMDHLITRRTDIGARRNTIEKQNIINEDFNQEITAIRSRLMDLDYAQAISDMNQEMLGLEAAQRTFVRMQDLSIFNYL